MKTMVHDFAAFGGEPLFPQPLHVGQPVLLDRQQLLADFDSVMMSGQFTNNGPKVREFEAAVANAVSVRHCVATCNATVALQIAARAMRLTGEIIMPSFTFVATAHAMEWIGLVPVFADVDPQTHTLDPHSAEACITPHTSAILPVHLWGHVCHTQEFEALCQSHGLRLLYDSSHAFGCQHQGRPVGSFGNAEVFSFHATKFVHAFEGGAIVTNDDQLAERCRSLRAFGISGLTEVSDIGTNGKMHELSAAAGLRSLESMPQRIVINTFHRQAYAEICRLIQGLKLLPIPEGNSCNGQYLVLTVDEDTFGLSRDQLVSLLRAEGLFARSYFAPGCHWSEPYRSDPEDRHLRVPLPATEKLSATVFQVPTGLAVSQHDIFQVGELLTCIHRCADDIRRSWAVSGGRILFHANDPSRPSDSVLRELTLRDPILREAG